MQTLQFHPFQKTEWRKWYLKMNKSYIKKKQKQKQKKTTYPTKQQF